MLAGLPGEPRSGAGTQSPNPNPKRTHAHPSGDHHQGPSRELLHSAWSSAAVPLEGNRMRRLPASSFKGVQRSTDHRAGPLEGRPLPTQETPLWEGS